MRPKATERHDLRQRLVPADGPEERVDPVKVQEQRGPRAPLIVPTTKKGNNSDSKQALRWAGAGIAQTLTGRRMSRSTADAL